MFDLKTMNSALSQLEEERGIPRDKIISAIEDALAAAYKKDYGKRPQIIRAKFNIETGKAEFYRCKIVVDDDMLIDQDEEDVDDDSDNKVSFNDEVHIMLPDAKKIKADVKPGEEITFPLEVKDDYGRIAAQTAKQVIIQRIREAEKVSVLDEYSEKKGEIVSGSVQRIERGNVFIDLGRTTAILPKDEQMPGEYYRQGERIRAYLYEVSETGRGIDLRLSRSHPQFLAKLFEFESPEIASETVIIESIAREAGARSKIAVYSTDDNIDPVGSLVGQRGIRVNTIINELGGEKIDIIEFSNDPVDFITNSLSPAKISSVSVNQESKEAKVLVEPDQFSLAIGKGGQNVRLAAKLTGWKLDISSPGGEQITQSPESSEATTIDNISDEQDSAKNSENVEQKTKDES